MHMCVTVINFTQGCVLWDDFGKKQCLVGGPLVGPGGFLSLAGVFEVKLALKKLGGA